MSICRCGVEVKWCTVVFGPLNEIDGRVPIEPKITLTTGPDRYRIVEYSEQWMVEALDPNSPASGHPDHRARCPR